MSAKRNAQPDVVTQPDPTLNKFSVEKAAAGAAAGEGAAAGVAAGEGAAAGAAAGEDFHIEIKNQQVIITNGTSEYVLKDLSSTKAEQYRTPEKIISKVNIPLPIPLPQSGESKTGYPRSPLEFAIQTPDSSGSTSADESGFSVITDYTYSFGDRSASGEVRGRFQIASDSNNDLVLVLSEEFSELESENEDYTDDVLGSPSEDGRSRGIYRLRF